MGEGEGLETNSNLPAPTGQQRPGSAGCWQGEAFKGGGMGPKQGRLFLILSFPVLGLNSILGSPLGRFLQRLL